MILKKVNLLVIGCLLVVITLMVLAGCSTKEYEVNLELASGEGGTVSGEGLYQEGEGVTVRAEAEECYEFIAWLENGEKVSGAERIYFYY